MELNTIAVKIAMKLIKNFEGCNLVAYPDPASPLYKALSLHNLLVKYMNGSLKWNDLSDNFKALSGSPWTAGYGETQGVTKDTVFTLEEVESRLEARVRGFMADALKVSPALSNQAPERIAAVTSLVYNIGSTNYKNSTVAKEIARYQWQDAANAFLLWNKAGGKIMAGLDNRRKAEAAMFMAVGG